MSSRRDCLTGVLAPFIPLVEGIAPPIPQEGDGDKENGECVGG